MYVTHSSCCSHTDNAGHFSRVPLLQERMEEESERIRMARIAESSGDRYIGEDPPARPNPAVGGIAPQPPILTPDNMSPEFSEYFDKETEAIDAALVMGGTVRKWAWRPRQPIHTPGSNGSFITIYPPTGMPEYKVTVGVDSRTPAIGLQWVTWDVQNVSGREETFADDFSGAQTWISSVEEAYRIREQGFLTSGTVGCTMTAQRDSWIAGACPVFCFSSLEIFW